MFIERRMERYLPKSSLGTRDTGDSHFILLCFSVLPIFYLMKKVDFFN